MRCTNNDSNYSKRNASHRISVVWGDASRHAPHDLLQVSSLSGLDEFEPLRLVSDHMSTTVSNDES